MLTFLNERTIALHVVPVDLHCREWLLWILVRNSIIGGRAERGRAQSGLGTKCPCKATVSNQGMNNLKEGITETHTDSQTDQHHRQEG